MKNVVLLDDLKESDIRPEGIYDEYKQLLSDDILRYFFRYFFIGHRDCPGVQTRIPILPLKNGV